MIADERILEMARQLKYLNHEKYMLVKPKAERILRLKLKDKGCIEEVLDQLLDVLSFSETEEALTLYRRLCRHFFNIDPQATFDYIEMYKEQCDPDESRPFFSPLEPEEFYEEDDE